MCCSVDFFPLLARTKSVEWSLKFKSTERFKISSNLQISDNLKSEVGFTLVSKSKYYLFQIAKQNFAHNHPIQTSLIRTFPTKFYIKA